jgi:hypothetical protein
MPSEIPTIVDLNVRGDDLDHHSATGRNINHNVYRNGNWYFGHYGDDGQWVEIEYPAHFDPDTGEWLVGQAPQINVWGRVIGEGLVTYSIDIEWGNMTFVFDFGRADDWNPALLSYGSGVSSGDRGWLEDNYFETVGAATRGFLVRLPGETIANNEVRVTNRSNAAVSVGLYFGFNWTTLPGGGPMGTEPGSNLFNDNIIQVGAFPWEMELNNSYGTAVMGAFYQTIEDAREAATISSTIGMDALTGIGMGMQTADFMMRFPSAALFGGLTNPTDPVNPALVDSRFFAFSGIPTPGRSIDLAQFTNVGRIMIGVEPVWEDNTP